jgi:NADH-quinone oxidoreductase subunit N
VNALLALSSAPTHPIAVPPIDWVAIAPELVLFGTALAIVLLRSLVRKSPRVFELSILLAVAGTVASGVCTAVVWHVVRDDGPYQAIKGMVAVDGFSVFVRTVVLVATLLAVFLSAGYLSRERLEGSEYLALLLLSATGMMIMATANDLVVVFLALEILSIALYVLAAFDRRRLESQEAGLKYFVLGAFSSAIFLYGIALTYGATGTTSLTGIATFQSTRDLSHPGVLVGGFAFLLVGLGFKVAAAPFHMWTPDVYQGAPTPVTAFMAAATKAAAFAAFLRIYVGTFPLYGVDWRPAVWGLAVMSLVVGTTDAIVQTNV